MGRKEREMMMLSLLADTELALPPKVVYINLKLQGATFSERTVKRRLRTMREQGYLNNPDIKPDYYQITDRGRAYLEGELDAGDVAGDNGG